jgi:hypothetical protein
VLITDRRPLRRGLGGPPQKKAPKTCFPSIWEKNFASENASKNNVYDCRYLIIFHLAVYSIACNSDKMFLISTIRRFDFSQIFLHFRELDYRSLKKNFFKNIALLSIEEGWGYVPPSSK